ncbi:uncharacterized protein LOC124819249 isoform X3 [Hydra vulgaris]|uniref:uncharacterized protein LOC124819249 isoform X3 n=1 Tax=Hydra vulgaris TaxID=6087 RepID=UPI0032EA6BF0
MFQKLLVLLLLIYANGKSAKSINGYEDIDQNDELAAIKSDLNDFSDLTVKLERPPTAPNLNQNIENTNDKKVLLGDILLQTKGYIKDEDFRKRFLGQ